MALNYVHSDFPEFENSTQEFWVNFGNGVIPLANISYLVNIVLSICGVFINIFHCAVLLRKSMINNVINVILLGISVCDIVNLVGLANYCIDLRAGSDGYHECAPPQSYLSTFLSYHLRVLQDDTRRVSSWLGVLMATLRYLILRNALDARYNFLSEPKIAWRCILVALVISTAMSSIWIVCIEMVHYDTWFPLEKCGFPINHSQPYYGYFYNEWFKNHLEVVSTFMKTDGSMKVVFAAFLPVLTVLLIGELRKAKKAQDKVFTSSANNPNKTDYTTKLVIIMTILNFLAEAPVGAGFIVEGIVSFNDKLGTIIKNLESIASVFLTWNATTHCFLCLAISTPYLNAVKELLGYNKKPRTPISVTSRTSGR